MTTYMIVPDTTMSGEDIPNPLAKLPFISESGCRRLCDEDEECEAFTFSSRYLGSCAGMLIKRPVNQCNLKKSGKMPTSQTTGSILFIKKGRKSFTMFWLFIVVLVIIVFVMMAQNKPK